MAVLTDAKARNIQPGGAPVPHGGVTGLALHPSASRKGRGKWVLRYVSPVTRRRRNAGLGVYPEIGIAEASKVALLMREQIANGRDPLDVRAAPNLKPKVPTLEEASKAVHEELKPGWKNAKHAQQWINTLAEYAFPVIGTTPLDEIEPRNVADALRPIWLEMPETASRLKQRLHAVMAWGWAHGYNQANPVDVVTHLLPLQPGKAIRTQHQPAMPWRMLPDFVRSHLATADDLDVTRQLLFFLILSAGRSGEVRGMTWTEVDLRTKTWTIPANRMKAKQPHRVPLSKRSVTILNRLEGLHPSLVFPSLTSRVRHEKNSRTSVAARLLHPIVSDMAVTALLRRLKAESDTPSRFATAHGFRSTFRDWCSENGYARDLAERSLAHSVQNKVEAAYHRTDLLEQRRTLMEEWANFVMPSGIINPT